MAGYKVETKSEVVPTNSAVINISIIAGFKDNNREIKILKQVPPTFHASRRRAPPTLNPSASSKRGGSEDGWPQ